MSFKRRMRRWRTRRKYPWWSDQPVQGDRPVVDVSSEADPIASPQPLAEPALSPRSIEPPASLDRPDEGRWLFEPDRGATAPAEASDTGGPEGQQAPDVEAFSEAEGVAEMFSGDVWRPEAREGPEPAAAAPAEGVETVEAVREDPPIAMREPAPWVEGPDAERSSGEPFGLEDPVGTASVEDDLVSPPEELATAADAASLSEDSPEEPEPPAPAVVDETPQDAPEGARQGFAQLEERLSRLEEEALRTGDLTTPGSSERIEALDRRLEELSRPDERVRSLEDRLARLEEEALRADDLTAAAQGSNRIDALERRVEELAKPDERVAKIEKAIQAIVSRVRAIDEARRHLVEVTDGLRGVEQLDERVRELAAEVEALRASLAKAAPRTKKLDEVEARTSGLEARLRQVEDARPRLDQVQRHVRAFEGVPERVDRLELVVRGLERTSAQVDELSDRVASLGPAALRARETEDAVRTVVGRVRELMKLSGRVGDLERRIEEGAADRYEELRADLATTKDAVAELSARPAVVEDPEVAERLASTEADLRGRMSAIETWMRQLERSILGRLDELGARAPATAEGVTLQDAISALRSELDVLRGQGSRA